MLQSRVPGLNFRKTMAIRFCGQGLGIAPQALCALSPLIRYLVPKEDTFMWTDERVEQLKSLWTEGLSASQIARVLGGVTRNAVIGKVHRLGLAGRASPSRSERPRLPLTPKVSIRVHAPEPPVVEEDPVLLDDGNFATVLTINDRMCRWPIGDPAENEFHFCGRKPKNGSPYCEAHARKAYQPQQLRRDRGRMHG
jgi:GcrA cell cycle regulator